jgi:hypothetical protein
VNSSLAEHCESVKRFHALVHYIGSGDSLARGVSVNLDHRSLTTEEQNSVVVVQNLDVSQVVPRIERCEFEKLLQRAMEILDARDLKARLETISPTSAV